MNAILYCDYYRISGYNEGKWTAKFELHETEEFSGATRTYIVIWSIVRSTRLTNALKTTRSIVVSYVCCEKSGPFPSSHYILDKNLLINVLSELNMLAYS